MNDGDNFVVDREIDVELFERGTWMADVRSAHRVRKIGETDLRTIRECATELVAQLGGNLDARHMGVPLRYHDDREIADVALNLHAERPADFALVLPPPPPRVDDEAAIAADSRCPDGYVGAVEFRERAGVSVDTLTRCVREGLVASIKVGRHRYYDAAGIDRIAAAHVRRGAPPMTSEDIEMRRPADHITCSELAAETGISSKSIQVYVCKKLIPSVKVGRVRFIARADANDWMARRNSRVSNREST